MMAQVTHLMVSGAKPLHVSVKGVWGDSEYPEKDLISHTRLMNKQIYKYINDQI